MIHRWNSLSIPVHAAAMAAVLALLLAAGTAGADSTFEEGEAAVARGDHEQAYAIWHRLALAGQCRAQFALAELVQTRRYAPDGDDIALVGEEGHLLDRPGRIALYWYRKAAEQGHRAAQIRTANIFMELLYYHRYMELNYQAIYWWQQAAYRGSVEAIDTLLQLRGELGERRTLYWLLVMRKLGASEYWLDRANELRLEFGREAIRAMEWEVADWEPYEDPVGPGGPCD